MKLGLANLEKNEKEENKLAGVTLQIICNKIKHFPRTNALPIYLFLGERKNISTKRSM